MFKTDKGKEMAPESKGKEAKKDEYLSEVARRDKFLGSQKGVDIEVTKNFDNYKEFNKNPSEHLINLYKKDLEKEYEILKKGGIDSNDLKMHLRNVDMLIRKIALFQEFGNKAEVEMLKDSTKEELSENKIVNTFRSFTNKQFLDSKFESLKSKFAQKIRPIKYAALALMFSLSPIVSQSQNKGELKGLEKNKLEDTRTSNINKTTEDPNRTYDLGADFRFTTEDENGKKESNILGGIIAPVALELDVNKKVRGNIEASIPLTYARDFKNTGLTNKEDSLKMAKYFEDQIREVVANTLIRIGETKGVYRANHEENDNLLKEVFSKLKITSINITGYASPEGSTAKSVIPGNQEEDNVKLAEKRAQIVQGVVEKILKENKIDSSVFDSVNFEEVQFSDSEWDGLIGIAESLGIKGSAPEDQILELVSRYNSGEYNDNASVKKIMDDIVGSKRGATIEIEYETNKKTQIIVPIPLLLLLLLSKRVRRGINPFNWKNGGGKSDEKTIIEDDKNERVVIDSKQKTPREIFSEKNIDEENVSKGEFNYYKLYETADKEVNYQDQFLIRKYFLEGELSMYIDDETSIKHGLDYRNLINHVFSVRERYNTEEELKVEIAGALLGMWEQYDRSIRKEIGIDINEKTTLDYRHDEKKILWAKIAAPEILRLAHKYNDPKDLLVEIQKIIQGFEEQVEKVVEKNASVNEIKTSLEKTEKQKTSNEVSKEEYDGMQDDLRMINRKIQNSQGIITLEELSFKSEYGKNRYLELKSIAAGENITFNKDELEKIATEMEVVLRGPRKIEQVDKKALVSEIIKNDESEQIELEIVQQEERNIFAEFKKFNEEHPTEKIPEEMEERYRKAEEKLKFVQEKSKLKTPEQNKNDQIEKTKGEIEKSFNDTGKIEQVEKEGFKAGDVVEFTNNGVKKLEKTEAENGTGKGLDTLQNETEKVFKVEDLSKVGTEFKSADGSFVVTKLVNGGLFGFLNNAKIQGIYKDKGGTETLVSYNKKELENELNIGHIRITKIEKGK